ncbi:hypothetical protein J2853_008983 [Streptosporangium lutulentum]|uniref:Uncharacterized protein n=1 Tax=Streptosporangium lutulentum TaxID=1461250 RepID=A0ABT9QSP0_9ACTN|nr:hypothetical protein [Streptosporangium lutulentum]
MTGEITLGEPMSCPRVPNLAVHRKGDYLIRVHYA